MRCEAKCKTEEALSIQQQCCQEIGGQRGQPDATTPTLPAALYPQLLYPQLLHSSSTPAEEKSRSPAQAVISAGFSTRCSKSGSCQFCYRVYEGW
jgi:hypothetical protein